MSFKIPPVPTVPVPHIFYGNLLLCGNREESREFSLSEKSPTYLSFQTLVCAPIANLLDSLLGKPIRVVIFTNQTYVSSSNQRESRLGIPA
ncbi:hypothetical protein QL285_001303 [Trifolium repens]|nr:hypothetical protein QL285_001303 [Trifolium repens]